MLLFLLHNLLYAVFHCSIVIAHCFLFLISVLFISELLRWLSPYFFITTKDDFFVILSRNLLKEMIEPSGFAFCIITVILVTRVLAYCYLITLLILGWHLCDTVKLDLHNVLPCMPHIIVCKCFMFIHAHTSTVSFT